MTVDNICSAVLGLGSRNPRNFPLRTLKILRSTCQWTHTGDLAFLLCAYLPFHYLHVLLFWVFTAQTVDWFNFPDRVTTTSGVMYPPLLLISLYASWHVKGT